MHVSISGTTMKNSKPEKGHNNSTGIIFKQKVQEKLHGYIYICEGPFGPLVGCLVIPVFPATVKMVGHVLLTHQHHVFWCHSSGGSLYKNIKEDSQTTSGHASKVICLLGTLHRIYSLIVKNYQLAHLIS
jgi:hypothetical protein